MNTNDHKSQTPNELYKTITTAIQEAIQPLIPGTPQHIHKRKYYTTKHWRLADKLRNLIYIESIFTTKGFYSEPYQNLKKDKTLRKTGFSSIRKTNLDKWLQREKRKIKKQLNGKKRRRMFQKINYYRSVEWIKIKDVIMN